MKRLITTVAALLVLSASSKTRFLQYAQSMRGQLDVADTVDKFNEAKTTVEQKVKELEAEIAKLKEAAAEIRHQHQLWEAYRHHAGAAPAAQPLGTPAAAACLGLVLLTAACFKLGFALRIAPCISSGNKSRIRPMVVGALEA